MKTLSFLSGALWQWVLPLLLTVTALIYAVQLHGRPVRGFTGILREIGAGIRAGGKQSGIFAAALAATMGTGNLIGTALALITGGAGAVFWMWISALLGMVLVYAENLLAARYQKKDRRGILCGGAIGMIRFGTGKRFPAAVFAVCCTGAAIGMGDTVQSSAIAQTLRQYHVPLPLCGLITALLLGLILTGGLNGIHRAAGVIMPLICGLYFLCCGWLIVSRGDALPRAFRQIIGEAFGLRAAGCGISISMMLRSLRVGFQRGIFSNEAGLGSSSMLHMHAEPGTEQAQCRWAAAEVFADTILCCTATALVILTAPHCDLRKYTDGASLLLAAFSDGLGQGAGVFLAVCMVLLAFATMIGWYPCGAAAVRYLTGGKGSGCYLALYLLAAFAGALGEPLWLWTLCDLCNGCMALPNLWAMLTLSQTVTAPCQTQE